jgi:hypothetical protein
MEIKHIYFGGMFSDWSMEFVHLIRRILENKGYIVEYYMRNNLKPSYKTKEPKEKLVFKFRINGIYRKNDKYDQLFCFERDVRDELALIIKKSKTASMVHIKIVADMFKMLDTLINAGARLIRYDEKLTVYDLHSIIKNFNVNIKYDHYAEPYEAYLPISELKSNDFNRVLTSGIKKQIETRYHKKIREFGYILQYYK